MSSWDTLTGNQKECVRTLYRLLVCTLRSVCAAVYLFLINYGRAKADYIHMVIPNFLQDCNDRNPLIRALVIRTMSYIPIPVVLDNLTEQLRSTQSREGRLRRAPARSLLVNSNATVVANAVAALSEPTRRVNLAELGESSEYGIQLSGIEPSAYWRPYGWARFTSSTHYYATSQ
ncbi:hypothetical protein EDB85DRAFT_1933364 [Lactarius pseudohatsudake]|nr:hypothetical protein EDB85DRAFT_1933364 [Lactarius pseudohatsudake]